MHHSNRAPIALFLALVALSAFVIGPIQKGDAQLLDPKSIAVYTDTFDGLLQSWNNRTLVLDKTAVSSQFEMNVVPEISRRAQLSFLGATRAWQAERITEWNSLPGKITPHLALSVQSEHLLRILFFNNVSEFASRVPPMPTQIKQRLELPLILTVGMAQTEATKAGANDISVSGLTNALYNWFTGYWPLCSSAARVVPMRFQ